MTRRYFFLCPDVSGPSGGVAVIYACVETLRSAGFDALVLHERPGYRYPQSPFQPPVCYSNRIRRAQARHAGRRARIVDVVDRLMAGIKQPAGEAEGPGPDDVLVVPDYLIADAAQAYPSQPKVIFSQNSFAYFRSHGEAKTRGLDPDGGVIYNLAISDSCEDAMRLLSDIPCARVTVCPNLSLFSDRAPKRPQIAYMPRKRPNEAAIIRSALQARGNIKGYDLVCVDHLPQEEVARIMAESLIFISLMHHEALGFPGIEAMSSACLVIGYTGLGTEEYFDASTGIPVTEGDTAGLVKAVEAAVREYESDPERLDGIRRNASRLVRARYNEERFRETLLAAWRNLDTVALSSPEPAVP